MSLSSAIDRWNEWKLRILVLCSLLVQLFLFFAGYVRQSYVLRRLRTLVWLAYIGGDAMAIYALGTIYNRQKQQQAAALADGGGVSSTLEVTWAPVLLIHLGGQVQISAYSIEDNELWKQHAVTMVSQVTVALYVFCNWWSGDKRILEAAILLFIVGILKFGQKPWALRRASYGNGSSTSTYLLSAPPTRRAEEESSYRWWSRLGRVCIGIAAVCTCTNNWLDIAQMVEKSWGSVDYSLEEYVKEAREHLMERYRSGKSQREKFVENLTHVSRDINKMFLDLTAPYSIRLQYLQSFFNMDGEDQHKVLREWIDWQFWVIYTKARSGFTCLGIFTFLVLLSLPLASVVLFAKSNKDGYHQSDITVTYILFLGTVVMGLAPIFNHLLRQSLGRYKLLIQSLTWQDMSLGRYKLLIQSLTWQDMVSQHNVMSFCASKKKPTTLMKLATFSYLRDYINKNWYIWHEPAAQQISMLVRQHIEDGWKEYICDAATYRRFNNLRGEHTLMKMSRHLLQQEKLGWTFNLPFDEYVLLWHLATNLCIHQTIDNDASASTSQGAITSPRSSEIISNYMIYLLFICPEMLIPGARQDLFILTCDEIEYIVKNQPLPSLDERSIARWVLRMAQDGDERPRESTMIFNAYKLAKGLIDLNNHTEMWELIQGVWVEMLCFSASRCRGYLHAKSLGLAGEFLTNVWLLWWCMGMQTLPDMMNKMGHPEPEE